MSVVTFEQIIEAFAADGALAEKVMLALNIGMWEEWDCDLLRGMLVLGFGADELRLAAKAVPSDIDWEDYESNSHIAGEVEDPENRYTIRTLIRTKNAGVVKDLSREEVHALLLDDIKRRVGAYQRMHYVLEVEVA